MFDQTYKTPEGFELHRPLLMPEVRAFSDVDHSKRVDCETGEIRS